MFRDIRCIKYRLPRSSVRATRAGSPVTEIRVSSRAQTFRAGRFSRAAPQPQRGVVDALHGWSDTKWSTALTVTWCWPYGIAPRAGVKFSAPGADTEVDGRTMVQANPLGIDADSHVSPLLAITVESLHPAAKALSTRKVCRYCGWEVSIVLALEDTPFCAL